MYYTIRIKDRFRYFPFFRSLINYSSIHIRYFMEKKIWDVVKYTKTFTEYDTIKSSLSFNDANDLAKILNKLT